MLVINRKELTTSLVHADNFGPKNHRNYAFSSYLHVLSSSLLIDLSSSQIVVIREKGEVAGKRKKPPFLPQVSSRFIFVFALSQFRGLNHLGAWNRLI